ncbi:MAG TPA: AsmA-like C-terminal region-containing protein [Roseiarcus sp.]|nr:AsmA-like C-terminal region-containing protein [Roseiarcus sp.]
MRTVLTIVAVALVALMSVALIAPYFIDWSAQRGEIESRLSAITGANVSLIGPVELRVLPTPYLALGEGLVSAPGPGGAKLSFGSARLELELAKLPSGQIRFSEIRLEKPVLTLTRGPDGGLKVPPLRMAGLHSTGFDRLTVQDGQVRIIGAANGATSEISGIKIDAAAPSLDGPMRLSGQFSGPDDAPVVFRLASERPGPDGTPLRIAVDAGPGWPAAEFDGALEGDPAAGARGLRFAGSAALTGTAPGEDAPIPWRVAGPVTVTLTQAALRGAEFGLGPEERGIRANGDATLAFGSPPRISVALKAKQANVDSLLRRKGEDAVAPARAVALIIRIAAAALQGHEGRIAVDAAVSAQPVILGAETVPDASATLKAEPGAPLHLAFNLGLPGQSRLSANGDLETGGQAKFHGDVAFASADFRLLRDWAALGAPPAVAKVAAFGAALPYRGASLEGPVEASATGFSGRNLKLTLDRTTLTGALALTGPADGKPGRLNLDLATDSLDVDALPSLAAGKAIADLDLALSLRAGSLHVARVEETEIDSGSLTVNLTKTGPNVALKRLSVAGLDGASLEIEGGTNGDATAATGQLRADRLRDFAALIARLAPGDWSRILVERAAELSPALLTFEAHGGAADAGAIPAIEQLTLNGSAGETQFSIALDPQPKDGGRALSVSLDSPNSGALLRQLGVNAAATVSGRARVSLNGTGDWQKGYGLDATSTLAGADLAWRGRFAPQGGSDDARLFGSARIKAPNLAPLAAALGLAPANGGPLGPADIGFDATLRGDQWKFSRIAVTIAGVKASGDLTFRPVQPVATLEALSQAHAEVSRAEEAVGSGGAASAPPAPAPAAIEGELTIARAPLGAVLALALGPPQQARGGTRWSEARFAAPPLRPPSAAVKLSVGTLDMSDGLAARDFKTTLRFDKGRLDLDDFAMQIAGGAANGRAMLRRDGDAATLTGALNLDSVDIDRPGFSGRVSAALDFASTGRSPAAVIGGLAGSGTVTFNGAALARSDPAALERVVAKAQTPDAPLDETNIAFAFGNELNRGPLAIPDGPAPVSLSAGVMKIGPIKIPEERGEGALSADLDLRKLVAATDLKLTSPASGLKFWSGPPPSATVGIENALEAPKRQIDVSSLSAALAAQAIARETDRIAAMEADIRERAFFNRRLKGERFMDRRRQEIQDFEVEQARLKGQAERLRDLEQADKEAEAAKKAAEAAATKAAAEKAGPDKGATDKAQAAKTDMPEERPAAPAKAPFAPAPAPRSDEVGANAPPPAAPTPPRRPRARPTQVDPAPGKLY